MEDSLWGDHKSTLPAPHRRDGETGPDVHGHERAGGGGGGPAPVEGERVRDGDSASVHNGVPCARGGGQSPGHADDEGYISLRGGLLRSHPRH